MGPDFALAAYGSLGGSQSDMQLRALLQDAAQLLTKEDAAWLEASKLMQLMQQHPAWYEIDMSVVNESRCIAYEPIDVSVVNELS